MKKTFILFFMLFFLPVTMIHAEDWREILRKKDVCRNCEKKALLIAIGEYNTENIKSLKGPGNDIGLIQTAFLKPILGYKSDEILVLMDREATKANIAGIMENWFLSGESVKERFFYFSGHGSHILDRSGDEDDGKDEVLLTCQAGFDKAKTLDPKTVIADDELNQWFKKIDDKKLVAMFDSCHSGTMSRSIGSFQGFSVMTPRFVENYFPEEGNVRSIRKRKKVEKPGMADTGLPKNHVYFYAAQSDQLAFEKTFENEKQHGCFTFALVNTAKEIWNEAMHGLRSKDVSYQEFFTRLNNEMKHHMNLQQSPGIEPEFTSADSINLLNSPFFSVSRNISPEPVKDTLPDVDQHKISVLLVQENAQSILSLSDLNLLKRYAEIDMTKKDKTYHLYINIDTAKRRVELSNENNDQLNSFKYRNKTELVKSIEKRIEHAFLKSLLEQIKSEHGSALSLKVLHKGKEYDKNDFYAGQEIAYLIESKVDAYVYLFSVDAGGELNLYLPFECQKDNKITKGGAIQVLNEECQKDFILEISSEAGEEVLKVVASPRPLNIRMAKMEGEDVSALTFEEALENIREMVEQLKESGVWYEETRKYMNHTPEDYQHIFPEGA